MYLIADQLPCPRDWRGRYIDDTGEYLHDVEEYIPLGRGEVLEYLGEYFDESDLVDMLRGYVNAEPMRGSEIIRRKINEIK